MIMTSEEMKQRLCILRPRDAKNKPQKWCFWTSPSSTQDLDQIMKQYQAMLGRPVSLSVVTRRALRLLADRLAAVETAGGAAVDAEVAALLKQAMV